MIRRIPPFRADQVGSLLRPEVLKQGREAMLGPQTPDRHLGPHGNPELRAVEDRCICECVAMQESVGLRLAFLSRVTRGHETASEPDDL